MINKFIEIDLYRSFSNYWDKIHFCLLSNDCLKCIAQTCACPLVGYPMLPLQEMTILNANDKDQWAWNRTHPASVWRHLFCFIIYRKSPNVRVVRNTSCFVPLLAVLNRLLVMATQCHIDHCWPLIQLFSMQVGKYLLRRPNGRLLLY